MWAIDLLRMIFKYPFGYSNNHANKTGYRFSTTYKQFRACYIMINHDKHSVFSAAHVLLFSESNVIGMITTVVEEATLIIMRTKFNPHLN